MRFFSSLLYLCFVFVFSVSAAPSTEPNSKPQPQPKSDILDQATGIVSAGVSLTANLLTPLEKARESARLESEGLNSRIISVYDNQQQKTSDYFNPQPIVDTISESEKYGNNGDQFYVVGRAAVNGYEAFSNLMNKLLDLPGNIFAKIGKGISAQLDVVGGKLVGLA